MEKPHSRPPTLENKMNCRPPQSKWGAGLENRLMFWFYDSGFLSYPSNQMTLLISHTYESEKKITKKKYKCPFTYSC